MSKPTFNIKQPAYVDFRSVVKERTTPLIAWIGSGLSARAGLPTWPELRSKLLETAKRKAETFDSKGREKIEGDIKVAESNPDYWVCFQILREALGATTYRDTLRQALAPAATATIPQAYKSLWKLGPKGILNLNLDRLATRALTDAKPGTAPLEFNGQQAANCVYALDNPHPFIVNLHGITEDSNTWVLTKRELGSLQRNQGYVNFIRNCLMNSTVLFLGLSVDDLAVGGHLQKLSTLGIRASSNFWITDRNSLEIDNWAEGIGVRIIHYDNKAGDHGEIDEFFRDLLGYVPSEEKTPPPVHLQNPAMGEYILPSPQELARKDAETIRQILNARAVELLSNSTPADHEYEKFMEFCDEYDEAIYRAWYVAPGKEEVLGYTLVERVARGAFGTVYRAFSPKGDQVAVKILNQEIRSNPDMLQSFRRGVRSMRILNDASVDGMAAYREASEIPAFVVMDWIEGPNLRAAVEARALDDWELIIRIALRLTQIVRSAHLLKDRVLHRDLRPANVMLRDFYISPQNWDVVVLDFDLSWHLGSSERSVLFGTETTGYLAPEQLHRIAGASTRNAAVDAFGIGMTLFFLAAKRDPLPTEHRHSNWEATVNRACSSIGCDQWNSIPSRFARAIICCTQDQQARRWDLAQLEGELRRLNNMLLQPDRDLPADILAEEIAGLLEAPAPYSWDEDSLQARIDLPSGLALSIRGNEPRRVIEFKFSWNSSGAHHRRQVLKWIPEAMRTAREILEGAHLKITTYSTFQESLTLVGEIDAGSLQSGLAGIKKALERALAKLSFD